ncbi:hypothetical protein VIGAN_03142800 [Vigna angularis var. angularis]|uniref:Uncharacterized protein n=1 Tax=Vigna angularis var. angularis TaxID=157739 RepID=A0A0S3RMC2_PHAAN|nr:hypothetical protein VIGAN_03142800 [Vigna angularis var. angularis]
MYPLLALAAMIEFQEISSFSTVSENTFTACSTGPHFPYMSIKQFATIVKFNEKHCHCHVKFNEKHCHCHVMKVNNHVAQINPRCQLDR